MIVGSIEYKRKRRTAIGSMVRWLWRCVWMLAIAVNAQLYTNQIVFTNGPPIGDTNTSITNLAYGCAETWNIAYARWSNAMNQQVTVESHIERTTNWVTLWQADGINHEAGVVTEHFMATVKHASISKSIEMESHIVPIDCPPQRDVPTPVIILTNNYIPWNQWYTNFQVTMTNTTQNAFIITNG